MGLVLVLGLAGCGETPADATDTLATACGEARETFAAAPAPADRESQEAFMNASDDAVATVRDALSDVSDQIRDGDAAGLAWQLNNFPHSGDAADPLVLAHRASAAIVRIDAFAEGLGMPGCGAATWRPADWRTLAAQHEGDTTEAQFREDLNDLCADTFPNPSLLGNGQPLLSALAARDASGESGGEDDDVMPRLLSRLSNLSSRGSDTAVFLRDFSRGLPQLSAPDGLERDHIALIAAFMHVESVLPNVMPDNPSSEFRDRTDQAFDELEQAWAELDITC